MFLFPVGCRNQNSIAALTFFPYLYHAFSLVYPIWLLRNSHYFSEYSSFVDGLNDNGYLLVGELNMTFILILSQGPQYLSEQVSYSDFGRTLFSEPTTIL